MTVDERSMRVGFLYLAAFFGLVVMVWGILIAGMGAIHWTHPPLGVERAGGTVVTQAPLTPTPAATGTGAGRGNRAKRNRRGTAAVPATAAELAAERARIVEEAKSDVLKGTIAFVVGGLVLLVGTQRARQVAAAGGPQGSAPAPPPPEGETGAEPVPPKPPEPTLATEAAAEPDAPTRRIRKRTPKSEPPEKT